MCVCVCVCIYIKELHQISIIQQTMMKNVIYVQHSSVMPRWQRLDKCRTKEYFKLNDQSRKVGNLWDGVKCNILFDTGDSKSIMPKNFYMNVSVCIYCQNLLQNVNSFK